MWCIHLPILQQLTDFFTVVAICDVDPKRLEIVAQKIGAINTYTSYADFLLDDLYMVVVLTLNHEEFIEAALLANKHVFTEKPISLDIAYSKQLRDLARARGLFLFVGLMRLYDKAVQDLYRQIPCDRIKSCVAYKADGSDASMRKALLPAEYAPYTFHTAATPILPSGLNAKQLAVLKSLLWSGVHMLTTFYKNFTGIKPLGCIANLDAEDLLCHFTTDLNQDLALHMTSNATATYVEDIKIVAVDQYSCIEFYSPYKLNTNDSAFHNMWLDVARCLTNKQESASLLAAIQIEELALNTAKLCQ